ncbi:MAG: EscU/YscU/HrcU family type III secretion system export apparatus switch protein [Sulfitobacter sp.]
MSSSSEAKNKPASARKLSKQREEGNVAQAADAAAMVAASATLLLLWGLFGRTVGLLVDNFGIAFDAMQLPIENAVNISGRSVAINVMMILAPVAGLALSTAIVITIVFNGGFLFAVKPIVPKLDRLSPQQGFKRIYGKRGWLETATGVVRISLWMISVGLTFWFSRGEILDLAMCGYHCIPDVAFRLLFTLSLIIIVLMLVAAGLDMLVQKFLFLEEQKMTESEVKKETKEQAGSPEVRKERKRQQRKATRAGTSLGVDRANMCFFIADHAVAMRYHPEHAPLPRITAIARGVNAVEKLRDKVRTNGFPERYDPIMLAGCNGVDQGDPVPEPLYKHLAQSLSEIFKGQAPR